MAGTDPGDGLRVLSLDGPPFAAAALSETFFLQHIAHRWVYNEDDENEREGYDVRISEMFDIIGGCGIGGLYAILFARLNMTIRQVIEFHNILQGKLFMADCWLRKDHKGCAKAFDDALDEILSRHDVAANLSSSIFANDCKKCFIVVLNEAKPSSQSLRFLRSYNVRAGPSPRCTIRQALHATLADLEYLPAVLIEDELFIGTSCHLSNPSRPLLKELATAFPTLHLSCFVNLGADYTRPTNSSRVIGQDLMSQFRDLDCFFRLSVREELHEESRIKTLVIGYLQEDDISNIVDKIVAALRGCKCVVNLLRLSNLAGEDGRNELRRDVSHIRNEDGKATLARMISRVQIQFEEIKRALKKIRPPYHFQPVHEHGCLAGTREDVLQSVENWAKDVNAPNVFWLEGYPGTGKTAISITLKQRLAEARRLGASCFFRREDASQHSLSTLLRSIASQLADNYCSIRLSIFHALNSGSAILESAPSIVFQKLIYDPLVAASVGLSEPIVLVLDAMDEYGRSDEDRMRLVNLLLPKWIHLPHQYKLFIASRSQGDLPLHLDLPGHMVRRLKVGNATSIETRSDIRRFFEHNFEEIRKSRGSTLTFVSSSELDALVDASAGLFIWASTVVEIVKQMRKRVRQILIDLQERGTTIGEIQMDALHRLYSTILRPLVDDDRSIISFLSAVICAKIPLPAATLSSLCGLDIDVIEDTVWQLRPVMNTVSGLRFVHKSFVDYVFSQHSPVQLSISSAELMLGESCFKIMLTQLHFNMGNMPSSYMRNPKVPMLYQALSNELQYASLFWGTHLTHIQNWGKEKTMALAKQIDAFLTGHLLYWVEVVSILGCFREAIEAVSILEMSGLGETVRHFSQDALAFLRRFTLPISQSYSHIYVSAVPWTPRTSLIRRSYLDKLPHTLKIVSNGDETWPTQLAMIQGHDGTVTSVAFSPDGSQIISGSDDRTIRIWDTATRQPVGEPLRGHNNSVISVVFSPDGSQIASGSQDKTVRIWNAATCQPVGEPLRGHNGSVISITFSPNGSHIVSGSYDKTIRIWDAATHQPVGEPLLGHNSVIKSVSFSPDGSQIVSGSYDRTIRIWDATTRQAVGEPLRGHSSPVNSVTFSPNGSQIVSGSYDKTVRIWDAATRQPVGKPLRGHSDWVIAVAFSPDGSQIVSGSDDSTIRIWDAATLQPIGEPLRDHNSLIRSVAFSPDGSQIVSGSDDRAVRIWDATTHQPIGDHLQGHSSFVKSVSFSPDGSQIVSGSDDSTIRIWDATTHQPIGKPLRGHNSLIKSVAFSPDGSQIVSGSDDKTVRIWDAATGQPVGEPLQGHSSGVTSVTFSPDGSLIVSGSDDKTIRIWDAATRQPVGKLLQGHQGAILSVAFSPNGSHISTGSDDNTARIWDAATLLPVGKPLRGHNSAVLSVAFSPDSSRIVTGSNDSTIRTWDVSTRQSVGNPLRGHQSAVLSVAFSPNGSQIVSGSDDKTVQIWDVATHRPVGAPFQGHGSSVNSIAFSPDGSQIVSGSDDNTIRIWDAVTPFQGHRCSVSSITLSSSSSQIVSGSDDNTVRIWDPATPFQSHRSSVNPITRSPRSSQIVSQFDGSTTWIWNAAPRQLADKSASNLKPLSLPCVSRHSPLQCFLLHDGWVIDQRGRPLVWIPKHLHLFLPTPGLVAIIGIRRMVGIDVSDMQNGTKWSSCVDTN